MLFCVVILFWSFVMTELCCFAVKSFIVIDERLQYNRGCYFPMQTMILSTSPSLMQCCFVTDQELKKSKFSYRGYIFVHINWSIQRQVLPLKPMFKSLFHFNTDYLQILLCEKQLFVRLIIMRFARYFIYFIILFNKNCGKKSRLCQFSG